MQDSSTSRVRWLLVFWMFVVSAVAYLDRVNIAIAGISIASEFRLDNAHLGYVFSAFVLGYALFQVPGGTLADRLGPRKILGLGVLWWAIFTTLITFLSPTTGGLLVLLIGIRFCLGLGEAVVYPASNNIVAQWIPSTERGVANGIIFAGVGFGTGMTPPIVAYLTHQYGWRSSFWVSAVLGLIAGGVWYLISRDKPEQHPWVSRSELAHIEAGLADPATTKRGTLSLLQVLAHRNIWAVTLSYFTYGYVAYIFFTWFPIYLTRTRHMDLKHSTAYTMLPPLAMMVGSTVGGFVSDRLTRSYGKRVGRCVFAACAIACCAVLVALGPRVADAQLGSFVLAAGAGSLYVSQSAFWSMSADIGKSAAGSVSGFMNMGSQLGGALTASVTPILADHLGWSASFGAAAALAAVGALSWLFVRPEAVEQTEPVAAAR